MKRLHHISLILPVALLVLLPSMRAFVPWMAYFTNPQFYVEVCENKARPEMHCNGACHVRKNMAAEVQQEEQSTVPRLPLVEVEELSFMAAERMETGALENIRQTPQPKESDIDFSVPFFEIPVPPPWRG